jgi:LacI family transcriptional regulator
VTTIKDVATLAGVGVGTASRVVSGKGSVSAATALKVKQAIETRVHPLTKGNVLYAHPPGY